MGASFFKLLASSPETSQFSPRCPHASDTPSSHVASVLPLAAGVKPYLLLEWPPPRLLRPELALRSPQNEPHDLQPASMGDDRRDDNGVPTSGALVHALRDALKSGTPSRSLLLSRRARPADQTQRRTAFVSRDHARVGFKKTKHFVIGGYLLVLQYPCTRLHDHTFHERQERLDCCHQAARKLSRKSYQIRLYSYHSNQHN